MGFNRQDEAIGEQQPADHQWGPCPIGLLAQMTARLIADERVRRTKRIIVAATTSAAAVCGAVILAAWISGFTRPGGISCRQCHEQFVAYHAQLVDPALATVENALTAADLESMREHIAACQVCRDAFRNAYPGVSPTTALNWRSDAFTADLAGALPGRLGVVDWQR